MCPPQLNGIAFGSLRLHVWIAAEIVGTWVLIATAIGTGSPLLMAVLKALGVLYLLFSFVLVSRYHTSDFGRKWVPVALKQWFAAPTIVRLRRTLPPFGPAVAWVVGIVLASPYPTIDGLLSDSGSLRGSAREIVMKPFSCRGAKPTAAAAGDGSGRWLLMAPPETAAFGFDAQLR